MKRLQRHIRLRFYLYDEKGIRENATQNEEGIFLEQRFSVSILQLKATPNPFILKITAGSKAVAQIVHLLLSLMMSEACGFTGS